ncbi:MAG: type II secretion system protein GspC [Bdellovibrionales bacterium]
MRSGFQKTLLSLDSDSFKQKAKYVFNKIKKKKLLLFVLFLAFLSSDLLVMNAYKYLLPNQDLSPVKTSDLKSPLAKDYKMLWQKNIFHTGSIPSEMVGQTVSFSGDPVRTSLSLDLKGTIVHLNPRRSVATIEDQTQQTSSYKVGDTIGGQAVITKIERGKVIFSNKNNNRLEYVELPEENKILISYNQEKEASKELISENSVVRRKGNKFEVNRSDITTHIGQLHEILQQARVVPHRVERDGVSIIEGYTFASIDKDSIYESLGFQVGDIIKTVNGESVENPQKALELFDKFRTSSRLKVLVERDGKAVEFDYGVNEDTPIN